MIQRFFDYLEPGGYLFLGHAESVAKAGVNFEPIVVGDSLDLPETHQRGKARRRCTGEFVSAPGQEFVEVFLTEASEHLQFLREYSGILMDSYPVPEDVERLYIAAHTLAGTSASYQFPLFSEVSGKLAHIFQYAMNATIGADAAGPLVEFISEAIAVLESDLIMVSTNGG